MAYKALLLDLDGNLHDSGTFWEKAASNAVRDMIAAGLPATFEQAMDAYRSIYRADKNGQRHLDDLVARFGRKGDTRLIMVGVNGYHETKYDARQFRPFPGVRQLVQDAKDLGLTPFIVTDGRERKQWDKIVRLGLAPHFPVTHVFTTQRDVGRKSITVPKDVAFYRTVLKKANLAAQEVILMGDHELKDIVPAKELGMTTIRHLNGKYAESHPETMADFVVRDIHAARRVIARLARKR